MFAFLATALGRDVIIGVVILFALGGGFVYYKVSQAEIATLKTNLEIVQKQATDLAAAKLKLENDIAVVKQAQDVTNANVEAAQNAAAQNAKAIRAAQQSLRHQATTDPRALEIQINKSQQDTLDDLEAISKDK